MALTLLTLALAAQETPAAAPTPAPTATAVPIPAAPVIVLPTPTPTARATPTPRAKPTPEPTPSPSPTETAEPVDAEPAPLPTPTPNAEPTAAPTAVPTPAAASPMVESQAVEQSGWAWWWLIIAAIAGSVVTAVVMRRRRVVVREEEPFAEPVAVSPPPPSPPPAPEPVAMAPTPMPPAARLGFVLRPTRAGLNLLSAVVEAELTVTNVGPEAAQDIRVGATLTSVHDGHEAVLAAIIAGEDGRPAVPPFALMPGETRTLRVVAAQPRDAIQPVSANGRPMLVPLVAINCRYLAGGERRQAAQSFAIGIERADSPKLAPFWLDQPPRTVTEVAARPHTERIER